MMHHPAAWKSPKSSSTVSCSTFSAAAGCSGESSALAGIVLVVLVGSAAGTWGGNSALKGEVTTPSVGETGEGGGGGSLRDTGASLEFDFSSNESLFRPCSKNADFVLVPVSFCPEQKQIQTLRKIKDKYSYKKGCRHMLQTLHLCKIRHSTANILQCSTVGLNFKRFLRKSSSKPQTKMFTDMEKNMQFKCHK
jgi:hypothetical protein